MKEKYQGGGFEVVGLYKFFMKHVGLSVGNLVGTEYKFSYEKTFHPCLVVSLHLAVWLYLWLEVTYNFFFFFAVPFYNSCLCLYCF